MENYPNCHACQEGLEHSHEGRCDGCDMLWSYSVAFMRYNDRTFVACHCCRAHVSEKFRFAGLLERLRGAVPHFDAIVAAVLPEYVPGTSLREYVLQDLCEGTAVKYHYLQACLYHGLRELPALC